MSNREKVVSGATSYLRRVGGKRSNRKVTADDVHTYLDSQGYTADSSERLSVVMKVLLNPSFTVAGASYVRSNRAAARGRMIREWKVLKKS